MTKASKEQKEAYYREQLEIEKKQQAIAQQLCTIKSQDEALEKLISFAHAAIPEIEDIINSCAQDRLQIWQAFDAVPNTPNEAKENYTKLNIAMKDYEKNMIAIINPYTQKESDPIITGYKRMFDKLKLQSDYLPGSNSTVERLEEILAHYMQSIMEKATDLYTQSKKETIDKIFSKIKPTLSPQQQYDNAVFFGRSFLNDATQRENNAYDAMKPYEKGNYNRSTYASFLYSKTRIEKNMIIERVLPYAEKIGKTEQSLFYVF